MHLPPRFTVTFDGTLHRVNRRHLITSGGLPSLLTHLLSGGEVPESAWAAFGLRVYAEVDTDQADDEPDGIDDREPRSRSQLLDP